MKPTSLGLIAIALIAQTALCSLSARAGVVDIGPGGVHIKDSTGTVDIGGGEVHINDGSGTVDVGGGEVHINDQKGTVDVGGGRVQTNYNYDTVVSNLKAKKVGDALVVNLENDILFDFDKAQITPKASETLKQLAYLIQKERKGLVVIRGYADSKGEEDYNLKLSQERANAVAAWLTDLTGLEPKSFVAAGLGEMYEVAPNTHADGSDNPEGRAQNRRVEILIQTVEGADIPKPVSMDTLEEETTTSADDFVAQNATYSGNVVVKSPTIIDGNTDYAIAGTLSVNAPLTLSLNGDINIARDMQISAPTTVNANGDVIIAGDLIVAAPLSVVGNGDIIVAGKIIVKKADGGLITHTGNGDVKGQYAP